MTTFFIILILGVIIVFFINILGVAPKKESFSPMTIKDREDIEKLLYTPRKTLSKEVLLSMLELVQNLDGFDNTHGCITLNNIGGKGKTYLPMYFYEDIGIVGVEHIGLSFSMLGKEVSLIVSCYEFKLNENDILALAFEDSKVLTFVLNRELFPNTFYLPLPDKALNKFATEKLEKWKISKGNQYILGDNNLFCEVSDIPDKETSQLILMRMASMINEAVAGHPYQDA